MKATDVIVAESDRLAAALAALDPATPVPTCPEWTARDLLGHITGVHHFWASVLAGGLTSDDDVRYLEEEIPDLPETIDGILPIRAAATRSLVAALDALDDDEPRWTWWAPDQTVGFTRRMQVCEAIMHRLDAELTAGLDPTPVSEYLAAHCINHCVAVMWSAPDRTAHVPAVTARITAVSKECPSEIGGDARTHEGPTWLVNFGQWRARDGAHYPSAIEADSSQVPTVRVTGTANALARWAWGRGGDVEISGPDADRAVVERVIAAGIQ